MPRKVTLGDLMRASRERADYVDNPHVGDSELIGYINGSLCTLHDMKILAHGHEYGDDETQFTTAADTTDYPLPATFYKTIAVDISTDSGGTWKEVEKYNIKDRNQIRSGCGPYKYRLIKSENIRILPTPPAGCLVKLWFHIVSPKLQNPSDEVDGINGYEEMVIDDVAIKIKIKAEEPIGDLRALKKDEADRVLAVSENRSADEEVVHDVYAPFSRIEREV